VQAPEAYPLVVYPRAPNAIRPKAVEFWSTNAGQNAHDLDLASEVKGLANRTHLHR